MNKSEFLEALEKGLCGLPKDDLEERLSFYAEMIDDRVDEGLSEEEAVMEIGAVEDIIEQITEQTPLSRLVKKKMKGRRRLRAWEIVLIAAGFPVWLPLLLAVIVVALSLYAVLWALVACVYAVQITLGATAVGLIAVGIVYIVYANVFVGIALIGAALVLAGLSIFTFFGSRGSTFGVIILTKKIILGIKSIFMRKESAK